MATPNNAPATPPAPPRRRGRLLRLAAWLAGGVLLLAVLALATLWYALRTEGGTAWVLGHVPGLEVQGARGRLLGDFEARRLVYRPPGSPPLVTLDDAGWRGLHIVRTLGGRWRIVIDELHAARVQFDPPPSTEAAAAPPRPPDSLALPVELQVHALRIGEFHTPALGGTPLRDLRAQLQLGAAHGALHRIDGLTLGWGQLQATGQLHIATRAPFALQATATLAQPAEGSPVGVAWQADATLAGPLERPELRASLRAQPSGGRPAQTLDATGALQPFAPWPVPRLNARTAGLDLSTLLPGAPVTALRGELAVERRDADQPASATLALANDAPGRWSEARLPVRQLRLALTAATARPGAPAEVLVQDADIELGNTQQDAGRVRGSARWTPERWQAELALSQLRPAQLDARAPAMRLGGPLSLAGSGFDSAGLARAVVEVKTRLSGALLDARGQRLGGRDVAATLDASAGMQRIELRAASLAAGAARATLEGTATREVAAAPWRVTGRASVSQFDPAAWWPGRDDSPWRQGPHRLNARSSFDLTLPDAAAPWPERLAALRGEASLTLADSQLAGVPLSGELALQGHGAKGTKGTQVTLRLDLAGNRVTVDGRLVPGGTNDHWAASVDAPALARLAPIHRLLQPGALAGSLTLQAQADGRWPAIATQGRLAAQGLVLGQQSVEKAQAHWQVAATPQAPLDVQALLSNVVLGPQGGQQARTLQSLKLSASGSLAAHQVELQARARALPPAWTDLVQAPASPNTANTTNTPNAPPGTLARIALQGGVIAPPPGDPWHIAGWRGSLRTLDVRSTAANARPWVHSADVGIEWLGGAAPQLRVQPGRAEALGGVLRWSGVMWQGATATQPARITARAELEPMQVAPILARLQPAFGWGGDLAVGGTLDLRSDTGFHAEVVVERRGGDLTVTEENATRALGLTDLRLGLVADQGVWTFTQALAGKTLGVAAGAIVARTTPEATWPGADAALDGVLEIRVADLGTWGNWVPPGWRLAGSLGISAGIGGRVGAPEYTGDVRGSNLGVRNFLEGVDVHDGELAIALRGDSARIERFTARAGEGTVSIDGTATLGEAPQARLRLTADHFRVLGRVDRRIVASGQAQLQLDAQSLALDGRFRIDQGLIDFTRADAPALSDDVTVIRAGTQAPPTDEPQRSGSEPKRRIAVDLTIDLGDQLRLKGRGLDTRLAGELHITAPGGQLALFGTVRTVAGTYDAYGQKLAIDRGNLIFNGPIDNPRLDIEATRRNSDIRVGVAVTGTAVDPRVRLFSNPEMSEMDKLSWLVLGRASSGLGGADTALLQRAALALLAGEGEGTGDQITRAIGLDELSVGQSDGDAQDTVLRLGKQLSRRWYVGYERSLNATTGTWQLIYRIAQRFTLRAQSGLDNSLDLIWTWRWQ